MWVIPHGAGWAHTVLFAADLAAFRDGSDETSEKQKKKRKNPVVAESSVADNTAPSEAVQKAVVAKSSKRQR